MTALGLGTTLLAPSPVAAQPQEGWGLGSRTQIACAPRLLSREIDTSLTLTGSQEGRSQYYYGPRDALVISGGSDHGVELGQEFFVRRIVAGPLVLRPVIHTTGWVRIVAVDRRAAVAQVVEACDGMQQGDFLEPTVWPELSGPGALGEPDYTDPGRIVFAPDGRRLVGAGHYAIIDIGTARGLTAGQRLTVFRNTLGDAGPVTELAQAVAVIVESDNATIRLTQSRDAALMGDLIAPHR